MEVRAEAGVRGISADFLVNVKTQDCQAVKPEGFAGGECGEEVRCRGSLPGSRCWPPAGVFVGKGVSCEGAVQAEAG